MDNLQPSPEPTFGQQPAGQLPPAPAQTPPAAPPPYGYGRYVPPPPPPPPRRSRLGTIVLVLLGVGVLGMVALGLIGRHLINTFNYSSGGDGMAGYDLGVEEHGDGPKSILMIPVHGMIVPDEGAGPAVIQQLRRLHSENQPSGIRVVILHVDSPGGDVTTCDIIDDEIRKCREKNIKFVAFFGDLAASGGYYVSARADRIIARPTSICGSIGVLMMHFDAGKLLTEKLGVRDESVISGPYKDVPSLFRAMTPEERAYMQNIVDKLYARFVGIVADGRGMKEVDVRKFADGRVFLADEAKKLGLIDDIGHRDMAIAEARRLAGSSDAAVMIYRRKISPLEALLQGGANSGPLPREAQTMARMALHPRMLFLWRP
ncbi:MAG TPA: signal peptide peptidase SppA [Planctomycetota bacterium]|nr:signal peptide peptidase SppA [Planctomycetota bacterium]